MEQTSNPNPNEDSQAFVHGLADEACLGLFEAYGVDLERALLASVPGASIR